MFAQLCESCEETEAGRGQPDVPFVRRCGLAAGASGVQSSTTVPSGWLAGSDRRSGSRDSLRSRSIRTKPWATYPARRSADGVAERTSRSGHLQRQVASRPAVSSEGVVRWSVIHRYSGTLRVLIVCAGTSACTSINDATTSDATAAHSDAGVVPSSPASTPKRREPGAPTAAGPLPSSLPRYHIELSDADRETLEASPWHAEDVFGTFIDDVDERHRIQLNYRGAFALLGLIASGTSVRNWKVKFAKTAPFLARREWNFNRETHLRHKLAYDLMRGSGVRVPSAEYVLLTVNGEDQGMYLRFEDPDNKAWLDEQFGSDAGDLFKAAYDVPNEPKRFAPLTVLGPDDSDYLLHYNKKLNNDGAAATDFTNLRRFIDDLNGVPQRDFEAWIFAHFDVESFLSYLVVSNFISNWDSYPQRPKNYWLYQSPLSGRWFFVPWDLDATFQTEPNGLAPMGTEVSIFHGLDRFEPARANSEEEGTERPLVRRLFEIPRVRDEYVKRYRELASHTLAPEYIEARLDELTVLCAQFVSEEDLIDVRHHNEDMVRYVRKRAENVAVELDGYP